MTRVLQDVVVAPLSAVVERGGRRTVFVVEAGRALALDVEEAPLHGDHVLIEADAGAVDLVVRGQHGLHDGVPVRVDDAVLRAAEAGRASP